MTEQVSTGRCDSPLLQAFVDTLRALFAQQPVGADIWVALAWMIGILIVAYGFAIAIYRRKTA